MRFLNIRWKLLILRPSNCLLIIQHSVQRKFWFQNLIVLRNSKVSKRKLKQWSMALHHLTNRLSESMIKIRTSTILKASNPSRAPWETKWSLQQWTSSLNPNHNRNKVHSEIKWCHLTWLSLQTDINLDWVISLIKDLLGRWRTQARCLYTKLNRNYEIKILNFIINYI